MFSPFHIKRISLWILRSQIAALYFLNDSFCPSEILTYWCSSLYSIPHILNWVFFLTWLYLHVTQSFCSCHLKINISAEVVKVDDQMSLFVFLILCGGNLKLKPVSNLVPWSFFSFEKVNAFIIIKIQGSVAFVTSLYLQLLKSLVSRVERWVWVLMGYCYYEKFRLCLA